MGLVTRIMFDIKKFLNGFAFWKGEQLGKIIFIAILITVGLAVYHQITRPTQSQKIVVQKGATATIHQQQPSKERRWIISGNVQSDKTFGISFGYMF